MIPIRCFTCGKVIADKWEMYKSLLETGLIKKNALDRVGLSRYCCRRMFLSHVEIIDQLLLYPNASDNDFPENSGKILNK